MRRLIGTVLLAFAACNPCAWAADAASPATADEADESFVHAGVFDGLYDCRLEFIGKVRPGSEVWLAINSRRNGDTLLALSGQAAGSDALVLAGQGRIVPLPDDSAQPPGPASRYRFTGLTEAGHSFALAGRGQQRLSGELGVVVRAIQPPPASKDARKNGPHRAAVERSETMVLRASLLCEGAAP